MHNAYEQTRRAVQDHEGEIREDTQVSQIRRTQRTQNGF